MNATFLFSTLLRWLANYGLSLSAVDYAVPGPEERESTCPFAQMLNHSRNISNG